MANSDLYNGKPKDTRHPRMERMTISGWRKRNPKMRREEIQELNEWQIVVGAEEIHSI